MEKTIKMNFPVAMVVDWVKKWAKAAKESAGGDAERAMVDDVLTMIDVANSVMVQKEAKK